MFRAAGGERRPAGTPPGRRIQREVAAIESDDTIRRHDHRAPDAALPHRSPDELARLAERDVHAAAGWRDPLAAAKPPKNDGNPRSPIDWNAPRTAAPVMASANPSATPSAPDVVEFTPGPLFRVQDPVPAVESVPEPVGTTPAGVAEALDNDRVDELLVDLSRELYQRSTYEQVPLRELFLIAAQSLIRPERALSVDAIEALTPQERALLNHFQAFFQQLGQRLDGGSDPDEVISEEVTALRNALIVPPRFTVASTALCYDVGGFGDYKAFDRSSFLAHSEQQLILYLEVEEFTSELNEKGQWVTELSQQLVIYSDRDGIPVWTAEWQPAVDVSKNRRQDFFTVQVITLPKALSVGRYQLKIRLRDEKSQAEAETAIEFEMVADPKLAARMP